ncbi:MAG TPA: nucleoside-triphosphatase [Polyangia bacterium]|jgi:nucleoside-triphosphatase
MRAHALLLTGGPGVGKTTVLRRVAAALTARRLRGFLTDEVREQGVRVGFAITSFDGTTATVAHVHARSPHRVGRYGVDLTALADVVARALSRDPAPEVFLVDEIGKMECLSPAFVREITRILDGDAVTVATIALHGGAFIADVKNRPDVEVWELTRESRDAMPERIVAWVGERLGA